MNSISLLADKDKCDLTPLDLFDRIINLKLTTADGEEYVIRSDYETYFPKAIQSVAESDFDKFANLNVCYIRKCQYKPSIKVQYKRVSMSTPVSVDIFISNFFMLDRNGKILKNFNNITNPLRKVEVELGYFGQFKSAMQKNSEANKIPVSTLFNFDPNNLKGHGITVISMCDVEYVQTDKLPPDMTVHIHGYVGSLYSSGIQDMVDDVPDNYKDIMAKEVIVDYGVMNKNFGSSVEKIFFDNISKNWVNPVKQLPTNFKHVFLYPDDPKNKVIKDTLTDEEAYKYGIQCYFSNGATKRAIDYDLNKVLKDSEGKEVKEDPVKIPSAPNAMGKVNAIKSTLGLQEFEAVEIPSTGDLLIYVQSEARNAESIKEMLSKTPLEKMYGEGAKSLYWKDKLPAVYNITTDALCTISCPFFFMLNPFEEFEFRSAYALGGLVSYYANFMPSVTDRFYALWQTVSFATVEDINECTIVCTGRKG